MGKKLIIGLGTGRCGTHSLARLFSLQGVKALHEYRPLLPWIVDEEKINKHKTFIDNCEDDVIVLVGFFYLRYIEILRSNYDVKFICMKRNKEQVVESYAKWVGRKNHWVVHNGVDWKSYGIRVILNIISKL